MGIWKKKNLVLDHKEMYKSQTVYNEMINTAVITINITALWEREKSVREVFTNKWN